MIRDSNLLKPNIPFSKDSDRGFNSAFYSSHDDKGNIIIDYSYTKFFLEMRSQRTPIYIQNIISQLSAPEKYKIRDGCKDGSNYRPKIIDINIDWNVEWKGFKSKTLDSKNMESLLVVDYSILLVGKIIISKH